MAALHIGLRAEIFQIDPNRRFVMGQLGLFTLKIVVGELATKSFNPDMGGLRGRAQASLPGSDLDFTRVKFEVGPPFSI
jgi:hypothetical protein